MNKKKRAAIYLRVSTLSQTTENQLRALRGIAAQRGWHIVDVYEDRDLGGSKPRDARPSLDRLYKDAARRKFDVVLAWSIDRLGRSLHHVVAFMAEIGKLGIDLYLHQQAVDSSTPPGRAMLSMCGIFVEFERGIVAERVRAGLARARAQGKQLGRPRISDELECAIRQRRAHGTGILKIAREVGVGVSVVQRVVRQAA